MSQALLPRIRAVRWRPWAVAFALVAALALAAPLLLRAFEAREADRARGQLAQLRTTLLAGLDRFDALAPVIAADGMAARVARGGEPAALNDRLARLAARTGAEAIYLMDRTGLTLAASNHDRPDGFVGRRYDFRPYFREALDGGTGRYFGVGATTGRPGYFLADPVVDAGATVGVVAVKLSLAPLEAAWAEGAPAFVSDADGVVILASDPAWRYRAVRPPDPQAVARARDERRYGGAALDPFEGPEEDGWTLPQAAAGAIHLTTDALPHGWTLHTLADGRPARLQLWTLIAVLLGLGTLAALVRQERRASLVRLALGRSRAEETSLRDANARLASEIEERRAAEARLRDAQTELRRASRLAALGQLAASVGHELSQPIAALRNHIAADARRGGGRLGDRLPDLVARMEGIVRQLKLFGRPVEVNLEALDLRDRVDAALDLLAPNLSEAEVTLEWSRPDRPVTARGDALRVEQVLVNVIRNAVDAVDGEQDRRVRITVGAEPGIGWIEVRDSGPGLRGRRLGDLAAPFETTRARSGGLGLGLAIATQILREHGGGLEARDAEGCGAVFRVTLPREAG